MLAKADELFANFDSHTTVFEDAERNYVAKQTIQEDNSAVTLVRWRFEGLAEADIQRLMADPMDIGTKINSRMTMIPLADDQGCKMFHIKMSMPLVISNRSVVTCVYKMPDQENGTKVMFHSSQGNEAQVEALQEEIGSDVVANMILSYWKFVPIEGGYDISWLQSLDPAGMIPDFIKTKMGAKMASLPMQMFDYIQKGTIPEPIL